MNGPMTTGNATWPNLGSEPPPTVWNQTRDGQLIDGRYRIERLLGVGGMGEVYVAQQLSMGRPVALKLLRTELAKRPQARERFYFEARAASRLNHPNIVTVFDFGSSKEGLFMAMELVNGDTLPSVLADGALDWRRALRLVREVADALAHAHVNDVIHCDVKTENLMLVQRGQRTEHLKILDFGIARLATSTGPVERNSGPAVGTPMAMAPEVILGDPPTPQADIYSLGVVLYEVLSGNQPFEHTTVQKLVQQKLFQAPQDLVLPGASPTTAAAIGDLIRWMMSARPDQRPRSCEVVRERLDGLLAPDATAGGILGLAAPSPAAAPGVSGPLPRIDPTTGKFNLLDALCASPDLPVFATVVQSIEALCQDPSAAADREIERMMTEIGLAQKVLRVANSTFYRGSHPEITRVSRAVMVMGLEQVRRVAMSLPLLGNLEGDADPALLESALRSLASAVMAKELADGQAGVNQEDASTGALMRNLSRHLVQVRFPELAKRVRARAAGLPEDEACREVLGATWEELNLAIAEKMAFPERLRRLLGPIEATDETLTPEEKRLRAVSAFGSELAAVLQAPESPQRNERLHAIVRTHADAITLDPARIKAAMEKTAAVVVEHAAEAGVGLEVAKTIARRVDQMTQPPRANHLRLAAVVPQIVAAAAEGRRLEMIVYRVLQALQTEAGFDQAVFCLRHFRTNEINGRLSIGPGGQHLLETFRFGVGVAGDPFSEALELGEDRYVAPGGSLAAFAPPWYATRTKALGFAFLPMRIRGQSVGVMFAEQATPGQRVWSLPEAAPLLSTLRDAVVDALRRLKT
jgi:HD-like signal output (HDOD) protein